MFQARRAIFCLAYLPKLLTQLDTNKGFIPIKNEGSFSSLHHIVLVDLVITSICRQVCSPTQ